MARFVQIMLLVLLLIATTGSAALAGPYKAFMIAAEPCTSCTDNEIPSGSLAFGIVTMFCDMTVPGCQNETVYIVVTTASIPRIRTVARDAVKARAASIFGQPLANVDVFFIDFTH